MNTQIPSISEHLAEANQRARRRNTAVGVAVAVLAITALVLALSRSGNTADAIVVERIEDSSTDTEVVGVEETGSTPDFDEAVTNGQTNSTDGPN